MTNLKTSKRGIATFDVVMGLLIVSALLGSIIFAMGRQREAAKRLASVRAASDAAEKAIVDLRSGRGTDAKVEPLANTQAPAGQAWVRVSTEHDGRPASLIGLVPQAAVTTAKGAAKP